MARFSVGFLGCKVSQTDAQALRERLLRDGHAEGRGDVALVNTCCVTNEALSKSRQAASRAARTHRSVYVTGCGARLSESAFAGLPENVRFTPGRSAAWNCPRVPGLAPKNLAYQAWISGTADSGTKK